MFVAGEAVPVKLGAIEKVQIVAPRHFWEELQSGK